MLMCPATGDRKHSILVRLVRAECAEKFVLNVSHRITMLVFFVKQKKQMTFYVSPLSFYDAVNDSIANGSV